MSDIVERLRTAASNNRAQAERGTTTTGEILTALGCQTKEAVAGMHDEAADQITRLRSLLKEAGEALEPFGTFGAANVVYSEDWPVWHSNIHREAISYWFGPSDMMMARSVLSKIKGEACD